MGKEAGPAGQRQAVLTGLNEQEWAELDEALGRIPAPFQPLDMTALDGFLVGVLLQPRDGQRPSPAQWWPFVLDEEGRALTGRAAEALDVPRLQALVLRRFQQLDATIEARQWFDPWVLAPEETLSAESLREVVQPWVLGFATACGHYPALTEGAWEHDPEFNEALAQVYQHLDPDDLEDAESLVAEIETLEPPSTMEEAVESLVRGSLLLADISRPLR